MTRQSADQPVALVTGGGSGIGEATVRLLAASGSPVVVVDLNAASAHRVAESVVHAGGNAVAAALDISTVAGAEAAVAVGVDTYGQLDVAVNCAGVGQPRVPLHQVDDELWAHVQSVNFDGVFRCLRAELSVMVARGSGSIVNVASIMGTIAKGDVSAYVASKHGVVGLTRAAAVDYGSLGIRVNAVVPGFVDTPLMDAATREELDDLAAQHALGRFGQAEEIAQVIVFLASARASFMTGSIVAVDGGYTAR
ncbi:SDR family oxidoreductase [Aeromicrobium sp.]|uniref:SDR family NAD(P)-dependent oxidoreductase n=1 Tax=Aeromicrobium sp. TaxID=1871063 RepID=UPI0019942BD8|nr:SDR family oxidoreductase [Aeromicrobium sp.]MBC7633852.1 SDR family oxidoreductase [Aeromicrobium sp.]